MVSTLPADPGDGIYAYVRAAPTPVAAPGSLAPFADIADLTYYPS
jgi:hypothetical protein